MGRPGSGNNKNSKNHFHDPLFYRDPLKQVTSKNAVDVCGKTSPLTLYGLPEHIMKVKPVLAKFSLEI